MLIVYIIKMFALQPNAMGAMGIRLVFKQNCKHLIGDFNGWTVLGGERFSSHDMTEWRPQIPCSFKSTKNVIPLSKSYHISVIIYYYNYNYCLKNKLITNNKVYNVCQWVSLFASVYDTCPAIVFCFVSEFMILCQWVHNLQCAVGLCLG